MVNYRKWGEAVFHITHTTLPNQLVLFYIAAELEMFFFGVFYSINITVQTHTIRIHPRS